MPVTPHPVFPPDGRRLILYRARTSSIEEYVVIAIGALREHASRTVVVLPEDSSEADRRSLTEVVDAILVSDGDENDIAGLLDSSEWDDERFDEILFVDDSWFGPVSSLHPVFARMDYTAAHAWTMTPAGQAEASSWMAVRRMRHSALTWREILPAARSAIAGDAATDVDAGGTVVAEAFPSILYPAPDPVIAECHRLLADGCPLVSRRAFTSSPLLLERHGLIARDLLREVSALGYRRETIMRNLARSVAPAELNASLSLLEIPSDGASPVRSTSRAVILAHFAGASDSGVLARRIALIPGMCDIVATTDVPSDVERVHSLLSAARRAHGGDIEVRLVPPTADNVSALFVACRDVLLDDRYDVAIRVHSAHIEGRSANARRYIDRHTWENMFASSDHASRVLALFDDHAVGAVFPPMPLIGYDTFDSEWGGVRDDASRMARLLGIRVPLGSTPLFPLGGVWIARVGALRLMADHPWTWDDYLPEAGWHALGMTQLTLLAHAAGELGFHVRTVLSSEQAEISHAPLEYKVDQLASTVQGFPIDRVRLLHRLGWVGSGGALDFARMHARASGRSPERRPFPLIARIAAPARRGRGIARDEGESTR